jgi:hypothetical protein
MSGVVAAVSNSGPYDAENAMLTAVRQIDAGMADSDISVDCPGGGKTENDVDCARRHRATMNRAKAAIARETAPATAPITTADESESAPSAGESSRHGDERASAVEDPKDGTALGLGSVSRSEADCEERAVAEGDEERVIGVRD